ncbi:MAG: hypothetical protein ACYSUI_18280, partial [Planctomycetota bacterium]
MKPLDLVLSYLKEQSYWRLLQPLLAFGAAYVVVQALTYEYLQFEYGFSPPIRRYIRSYLSCWITIIFLGIALVAILFSLSRRKGPSNTSNRVLVFVREHKAVLCYRALVLAAVFVLVLAGMNYYAPSPVGHIRIKFWDPPDSVDPYTFAYIVYELNQRQDTWHFEVDFGGYYPANVVDCPCEGNDSLCVPNCYAQQDPQGRPLILITGLPIPEDLFSYQDGKVAIISTVESAAYAPLTDYEYL